MLEIRYACEGDKGYWRTLDRHLSDTELDIKIRDRRSYIISLANKPIGVMRYNLFWDNTPFLTLIYIEETYQGRGFGREAMLHWEAEMKGCGYEVVMTSTQADENAQHFYRKLGYIDKGSLFLDNTPLEQPAELIMLKVL